MQKAVIRRFVIERRLALSADDVAEKSAVIQRRFLDTEIYRDAAVIASYSSFMGEVHTDLILETALSDGKTLLLPKINMEDCSMAFLTVTGKEELEEAGYGFKEPLKGNAFEVFDIDLFVVPGVAYDDCGNRLGMGKGYYDRALAGVEKKRIVAPAYEFQLMDEVPSFSHDLGVGCIITERRIINTKRLREDQGE